MYRYALAEKAATDALKLDPKNLEARYRRALANKGLEKESRAYDGKSSAVV